MVIARKYKAHGTRRVKMLEDTTRWLDWALKRVDGLPRIPRTRVGSGVRFSERLKVAFWSSVLIQLNRMDEPSEDA